MGYMSERFDFDLIFGVLMLLSAISQL
jgi:hypothetical protein